MASIASRVRAAKDVLSLSDRMAALEEEVMELRQMNMRLAEIADVVMELLVPLERRDQEQVDRLIDTYRAGLGDPLVAAGADDGADDAADSADEADDEADDELDDEAEDELDDGAAGGATGAGSARP
jgi:hypothetical protein